MNDETFGILILVIGFLLVILLFSMRLRLHWWEKKGIPKASRYMSWMARKIAKMRWYVQSVRVDEEGQGTWVNMVSDTMPRQRLDAFFRFSHPDLELVTGLQRMSIVTFDALEQPLETELEFEITAHIRVHVLS